MLLIAAIWLWILKVIDDEITLIREEKDVAVENLQKKITKHNANIETLYDKFDKLATRVMRDCEDEEEYRHNIAKILMAQKDILEKLTAEPETEELDESSEVIETHKDDVQEVIEHFETEIAAAEEPKETQPKPKKKKGAKKK